jgi:hypothetical protein
MKLLQAHPSTWSPGAWADVSIDEDRIPSEPTPIPGVSRESVRARGKAFNDISGSLSAVRILAFCHAIFFLVLFLFICAWAGAATTGKSAIDLRVISSAYAPQKGRNPFTSGAADSAEGAAATTGPVIAPGLLKLSGILYDPVQPSAVVNNQLVELKKPVKVRTGQGEVKVKALEIGREFVLLEVGDQKLELWLSGHKPGKQTK